MVKMCLLCKQKHLYIFLVKKNGIALVDDWNMMLVCLDNVLQAIETEVLIVQQFYIYYLNFYLYITT